MGNDSRLFRNSEYGIIRQGMATNSDRTAYGNEVMQYITAAGTQGICRLGGTYQLMMNVKFWKVRLRANMV